MKYHVTDSGTELLGKKVLFFFHKPKSSRGGINPEAMRR